MGFPIFFCQYNKDTIDIRGKGSIFWVFWGKLGKVLENVLGVSSTSRKHITVTHYTLNITLNITLHRAGALYLPLGSG